jgi:hypothetical protein
VCAMGNPATDCGLPCFACRLLVTPFPAPGYSLRSFDLLSFTPPSDLQSPQVKRRPANIAAPTLLTSDPSASAVAETGYREPSRPLRGQSSQTRWSRRQGLATDRPWQERGCIQPKRQHRRPILCFARSESCDHTNLMLKNAAHRTQGNSYLPYDGPTEIVPLRVLIPSLVGPSPNSTAFKSDPTV